MSASNARTSQGPDRGVVAQRLRQPGTRRLLRAALGSERGQSAARLPLEMFDGAVAVGFQLSIQGA
ncbi:MAG TPA: hypothetical protein VGM17_18375 [Rhizomicrobium sp.]